MFGFLKARRREKLRAEPFPAVWRSILEEKFPLYQRLSVSDRLELEAHITVFLAEKRFEGCGGFEITDDVRVIIAAQACLLLLHRETDYSGSAFSGGNTNVCGKTARLAVKLFSANTAPEIPRSSLPSLLNASLRSRTN